LPRDLQQKLPQTFDWGAPHDKFALPNLGKKMTAQHHIPLHGFKIGNDLPFTLLAGTCAMES
jgi:hypothetical protein